MKKILLLLIPVILMSCSESDDQQKSIEEVDLIVGIWQPYKEGIIVDGEQKEVVIKDDECYLKTRHTFNENNTGNFLSYEPSGEECNISRDLDFYWIKNDAGKYQLTTGDETDQYDKVYFTNDGNNMIIEHYYVDGDVSYTNFDEYIRK